MHNVLHLNDSEIEACRSISGVVDLQEIFSENIIEGLSKLRSGAIDNLVLQGLPVPDDLPNTPTEIRGALQDMAPAYVLRSIGNFMGTISPKGIENTIRFRLAGEESIANEETWHGHYQFKFSVFYCLREDIAAKIFLFSANDFIVHAPEAIKVACLAPYRYVEDKEPFALVKKDRMGYEITHEIYDRSDFEKTVKDLDLPDVMKALERIIQNGKGDQRIVEVVGYLIDQIKNHSPYHIYRRGDITMYSDASTMRYSPTYAPSTEPKVDRWLLAMAIA